MIAFNPSRSAISIFLVPLTTIALRFLLAMTSPIPVRPLARFAKLMMAENSTPFSAPGPC